MSAKAILLDILDSIEQEGVPSEGDCYTVEEVADKLGVSRRTVEKEIAEGKIGCIKIRTMRRIPHEQYMKYLRSRELA